MHEFVQKNASTLNTFILANREYYHKLYINKTLPLDENTYVGLPAFSSFEISKTFSSENAFDITVQTVSDRARNPKNAASESELKAIAFFNKDKTQAEYFVNEGQYFQYATPLYIEQKCLTCHGAKEDAPKFVSNHYTEAYDYKIGELRGIVSIKIPKEKIGKYFMYMFLKNLFFDLLTLVIIFLITYFSIKYFKNLAQSLNTEVHNTTNDLEKNIAFLKSHQVVLDESSIVSKADIKGNITYVNENFCKISGYTQEELLSKPHSIVSHKETGEELFRELWSTIRAKRAWKGVIKNSGKKGDYWVDITILPILDAQENIVEYIAVRHDITKMIEQQQMLDNAANTDTLTGYGNRYKLNNDINSSIKPALAIINIDNFSQINDFYGHAKGDLVIKKLGDILAKIVLTERCKIYHLQGDEYVLFNSNIEPDLFIQKMTKLTAQVAKSSIKIEGEELSVNFSTAISFESKEKLLITADMALKIARRNNKNLIVYEECISLNDEYENNIKWTKKIEVAIKNDDIVPVFQPIVNNISCVWEKYEALVRLQDGDRLIPPFLFLDIAKKTKHYTQITKIMIEKTFEIFKDKEFEFSINLTIEDILNNDIKVFIFAMLDSYKLGPRVVFEIVESESIQNFEEVSEFIQNLKRYGCKVAIDDFGTGYSNFEYLLKLKVDYIKIDGSLIKEIDTNEEAQLVVSTIVDFAKKMKIKTIAEFVASEAIFYKVKELEIDYSQGYYFSPPQTQREAFGV